MGTNYYLHTKPGCKYCGRDCEPLHIGKSSGGWCFSLHVMPEDGIKNLDDWSKLWNGPGALIRNEYNDKIPIEEMENIITKRMWRGEFPQRHEIDGVHCISHGSGSWDCITGNFS